MNQKQFRGLIDTIPQQIWSGPADGSLDFCNEHWRSYMGISLEELQGEGWQKMLHPDDRDRVLRAWKESVMKGTPYEQEERHRSANGEYRWFLSRGAPLRDGEGQIIRWYGTNTDIEEAKRAEQILRQLTSRGGLDLASNVPDTASQPDVAHRGGLPMARLKRVLEHIDSNLGQRLRLSTLAGIAGMSLYHFAALFKQAIGLSPYQYILNRRIQRAMELLGNPKLSVLDVSISLGFDHQNNFARAFRRIMGISPTEFRRDRL